jgi:Kdo2-lipid IVA lauroyltransferase/acyltransferase
MTIIPQHGRIADVIQASFYYCLRALPTEWTSAIGSGGIRWNARVNRPDIIANAKKNLLIHHPDASEAQLDVWVDEFLDGVGRVAAEFAVMHRFIAEGRVQTVGFEKFAAVAGKKPIIALCVHTGNWEVYSLVFQQAGIRLASIIQPPASAFERFVVDRMRKNFGVETIDPDIKGTRQAIRVLKANRTVSMFPDEARDGRSMAPLFGRAPHEKGNLAIAARLARMTGASFVLGHCRRVGACRFVLTSSDVFDLPARENADPLADVAFLNAKIEPIILDNIPRWYFLDDRIEDIA